MPADPLLKYVFHFDLFDTVSEVTAVCESNKNIKK